MSRPSRRIAAIGMNSSSRSATAGLWSGRALSWATATCGSAMYSVQLITDERTFMGLETAWNDTVDRAGIAHPFLRHEWVRTWWECFGTGHALHILVVKCQDRVCAIAPLMAERTQMYGVPIHRLRLMHNDHTPRADFIIAEQPDESYHAIWETLQS